MRRIMLTLAVALFSVSAPLAPSAASAATHKVHRPLVRTPSRAALAIEALQDHRQLLDLEAHVFLASVATRFHVTLSELVQKWQRVAVCEVNGNWSMTGPYYSGIGFSNATWNQYGGTRFAALAGEATPLQQIVIGMKITRNWIPDQYGCSPFGW
ncbi:MAG TPA: transglycosylase family protein [Acidimicrobiales bacterium]